MLGKTLEMPMGSVLIFISLAPEIVEDKNALPWDIGQV